MAHDDERDARDDRIEAIVEVGRRTRTPLPRWLWIAAGIAGALGALGFVVVLVAQVVPTAGPAASRLERQPVVSSGLGTGLAIGGAAGIAVGFSIGRQRRSHSSRSRP